MIVNLAPLPGMSQGTATAGVVDTAAAASAASASASSTSSATSATAAAESSSSAANSASAAASSANAAATSATSAGGSATTATTQAGISTAQATSATGSLNALLAKYIGASASDPAVDGAGNALTAGATYFSTAVGRFKTYNGSAWVVAPATVLPTSGVPTSVTGADGDFAYDNTAGVMYGPRAAGVWPTGRSLVGPQGTTAVVNASIYATTAAGIAATTNGQFFAVQPSLYAGLAVDIYKNNSGAAVYQFSQVSAGTGQTIDTSYTKESGWIAAIKDAVGRGLALCDNTSQWAGKFVKAGGWFVSTQDPNGYQTISPGPIGGATFDGSYTKESGFLATLKDAAGRLGWGLRTDNKMCGNFVDVVFPMQTTFDPFSGRQSISYLGGLLSSSILCVGDSLTAGTGGSSPYFGYPGFLATLYPSRTITTLAIGGQTSTQILKRIGFVSFTISLSSTTMTTGANSVSAIDGAAPASATSVLSTPATPATYSIAGTVWNVHGTLTRTATGTSPTFAETYTFTPDAGAVLPAYCLAGATFIPDARAQVANSVASFWTGRNDLSTPATVIANDATIAATMNTGRYIVFGVHNGATESVGTGNYANIMTINNSRAAMFGARFFDVRRYLIDNAVAICAANSITMLDTTYRAQDRLPTDLLYTDGLHLIQAAYNALATQEAAMVAALGD